MASLINFTRVILQSLYQASFNILNDNSLGGGGGGNLKNDGFIFPHIQSRSKPCANDVLRYFNIKGPSKNSCTWWYNESKNLNNCLGE